MKKLTIWTARVDYKQKGKELVLNTTATRGKGLGKLFAPTWDLVDNYKKGLMTWEEYTRFYTEEMRFSYMQNQAGFEQVCEAGEVVLLCFCGNRSKNGRKCHRYLLADLLEKVAKRMGIEVKQGGERLTYTNRVERQRMPHAKNKKRPIKR